MKVRGGVRPVVCGGGELDLNYIIKIEGGWGFATERHSAAEPLAGVRGKDAVKKREM